MIRVLLVLVCLLAPLTAHADNKADKLNKQGIAAAQRKDWQHARELFEQSYALDPRPLTLYNLAAAQEHTDRLVEAHASYQTFLDVTKPGTSDEYRAAATAALQKLQTAIPTLQIHATGFAPEIQIQLDARVLGPSDLAAPIALDPGAHTVSAVHGADTVASKQLTIAAGAREQVDLTAPVLPPPVPLRPPPDREPERPPPPPPPRHESGMLASPWFWVIASSVVVGAAAGGGIYYHSTHASDPTRGSLGGTITAP